MLTFIYKSNSTQTPNVVISKLFLCLRAFVATFFSLSFVPFINVRQNKSFYDCGCLFLKYLCSGDKCCKYSLKANKARRNIRESATKARRHEEILIAIRLQASI